MRIPYRVQQTVKNIGLQQYKSMIQKENVIDYNSKIAVFYMGNLIPDRRAVQIYRQLSRGGYKCYVYFRNYKSWVKAAFLHNWRYSDLILRNGIITRLPERIDICVCSSFDKRLDGIDCKVICIHDQIMDKLFELRDEAFFYPILFHPSKMTREFEKKCTSIKFENKDIGILFIGNVSKAYDKRKDDLHKKYQIFSRPEVLTYLKKNCGNFIFEPTSIEEYKKALYNGLLKRKIVLIKEFRLNEEDYIEALGRSKYFLFNAGVNIPYCHNQIESAACACVPITNFPQYYPDLKDGKNCITYSSLEELGDICKVLCMEETEGIKEAELFKGARDWYMQNYSFAKFNEKLDSFMESCDKCVNYYVFKELSPFLDWCDRHTPIHF